MSIRYGDKTRASEPVGNAGQRQGGGSKLDVYEQEFIAPGTWTWPGNVSYVQVLIVGGGGGSNAHSGGPIAGPGGAGGGVGTFNIPVSGPVPVTVGAGGAGFTTTPPVSAQPGGSSSFGPVSVGGGRGGSPSPSTSPIPSVGGNNSAGVSAGKYGANTCIMYIPTPAPLGGLTAMWLAGGAQAQNMTVSHNPNGSAQNAGGDSRYGYGAGGASMQVPTSLTIYAPLGVSSGGQGNDTGPGGLQTQRANTGHGGSNAMPSDALPTGQAGASGIVIVRWIQ